MIHRKPEGYKELLAYQKAVELHRLTVAFTSNFPKAKNMFNLKDQMDRSGRSGGKNIVEGWKRNSTDQYFEFLGYSIAAVEELKDDYRDIATGVYPELMMIPELWKGSNGIGMGEKGVKGDDGSNGQPLNPFQPFNPFSDAELEALRFYPLDPSLPLVVQLYLRAKEVLMLLHKLQSSLDVKMDKELTKPSTDRARQRILQFQKENRDVEKIIADMGMVRLIDGRVIKREEWEKRVKRGENLPLYSP